NVVGRTYPASLLGVQHGSKCLAADLRRNPRIDILFDIVKDTNSPSGFRRRKIARAQTNDSIGIDRDGYVPIPRPAIADKLAVIAADGRGADRGYAPRHRKVENRIEQNAVPVTRLHGCDRERTLMKVQSRRRDRMSIVAPAAHLVGVDVDLEKTARFQTGTGHAAALQRLQCVGKLLANREGAVRQPLTRRETALDKRRRGY